MNTRIRMNENGASEQTSYGQSLSSSSLLSVVKLRSTSDEIRSRICFTWKMHTPSHVDRWSCSVEKAVIRTVTPTTQRTPNTVWSALNNTVSKCSKAFSVARVYTLSATYSVAAENFSRFQRRSCSLCTLHPLAEIGTLSMFCFSLECNYYHLLVLIRIINKRRPKTSDSSDGSQSTVAAAANLPS